MNRASDSTASAEAKNRDFLSRVLAWPKDEDAPGFVNLHWTIPSTRNPAKPFWLGKPFRTLNDFTSMARWVQSKPTTRDIYMCMSTQAKMSFNTKGNAKAERTQADAVALKAIWIDVDVKPPPKGYADVTAAVTAIFEFATAAKLPAPSALIGSGGGVHVYWISDRALTPQEWKPYAEGLKALALKHGLLCDAGCTTDSARVLRVPGTKNFKSDPPRPVTILHERGPDYDFGKSLAFLRDVAPVTVASSGPDLGVLIDPSILQSSRPQAFMDELPERESLADGVRDPLPPINPHRAFVECGFLRDALTTGGKEYTQPMWNLTTLAAVFMENGRVLAHAMGKGHPGYTHQSTEDLWARKVREHETKGLGYPSCNAIQSAGCKACASCPHFGKVKSPLNLASSALPLETKMVDQVKNLTSNPAVRLMKLKRQGASNKTLYEALNESFAVTKYGGQIVIAQFSGNDITFMNVQDLHKMFGNMLVLMGDDLVPVSRPWFRWDGRRQYLGRGAVFEPGGPLETPDDMINLWRGFGVEPARGKWSLLVAHIFNVVCSGNPEHFRYLIGLMAYHVQHPNEQLGVAIALLGPQGAGKGVVARTFGGLFGKHFTHISHGDQLTGRFNASLATSCVVFLDEAVWAGDKKGEGTLKALITEPTFQMEAKFRDPIMVKNTMSIWIASNNDWAVPAGVGDRRWFILHVADTYAGMGHPEYWHALYSEIENGGAAAMLYDLLKVPLTNFDPRAIPQTAAKAEQQVLSLRGTTSWLYHVLQEGTIGYSWSDKGFTVATDGAYDHYKEFIKQRREWQPDIKAVWSKKMRAVLGSCVTESRPTVSNQRVRSFQFAPLPDCRRQFAGYIGSPELEWAEPDEPMLVGATVGQTAEDIGCPSHTMGDSSMGFSDPEVARAQSQTWGNNSPSLERSGTDSAGLQGQAPQATGEPTPPRIG
jgi:hypothetical protein